MSEFGEGDDEFEDNEYGANSEDEDENDDDDDESDEDSDEDDDEEEEEDSDDDENEEKADYDEDSDENGSSPVDISSDGEAQFFNEREDPLDGPYEIEWQLDLVPKRVVPKQKPVPAHELQAAPQRRHKPTRKDRKGGGGRR